ncbi:MAG: DUF72 domain-containing protein [Actinomycetota bacterium]
MPILVGTSGWQYKHWKERFYAGVPQRAWLEFYAERFQTVELNNSFYMLPKEQSFDSWRKRTPGDFVVGVKVSRYLSHIKRLKDPQEPVERFMRHARRLGPKLGPLLLQLPPNLKIDLTGLDETLRLFGRDVRVAVEFRHDTWFVDEVKDLLVERGAAFVLADRGSQPITPLWRTADWGYVRWHAGSADPSPCYTTGDMREWAARIAGLWGPDEDVYAYFNNDPGGCALRDAIVFAKETERLGYAATRVPPRSDVRIGELPEG